jgi:hypothetical protein
MAIVIDGGARAELRDDQLISLLFFDCGILVK